MHSSEQAAKDSEASAEGVALLLVDIQYDFIDGSLAVEEAESIIEPVQRLVRDIPWSMIVASQDFHPANHVSFASNHPGGPGAFHKIDIPHPNKSRAERGDTIEQMLWPDHCVQGTRGCAIHTSIKACLEDKHSKDKTPIFTVRKGNEVDVDGYSAFADNAYLRFSELARILFSATPRPIDTLFVVGLATDYCVLSSAIDSAKFGLRTVVVQDAVRGVARDSSKNAWEEMSAAGIEVVSRSAGTTGSQAIVDAVRQRIRR